MKTEAAAGAGRQIVNGLSHVEISGRPEFIDSHDVRIASVALIPDSFPNVNIKKKNDVEIEDCEYSLIIISQKPVAFDKTVRCHAVDGSKIVLQAWNKAFDLVSQNNL